MAGAQVGASLASGSEPRRDQCSPTAGGSRDAGAAGEHRPNEHIPCRIPTRSGGRLRAEILADSRREIGRRCPPCETPEFASVPGRDPAPSSRAPHSQSLSRLRRIRPEEYPLDLAQQRPSIDLFDVVFGPEAQGNIAIRFAPGPETQATNVQPGGSWRIVLTGIGTASPRCPYCGYAFEKMPQRKRACPKCTGMFYSRKRALDGAKVLLTEAEARDGEAQDALLTLTQEGVTDAELDGLVRTLYGHVGRVPRLTKSLPSISVMQRPCTP
jgi:predicted  nucleic acid-binding Zn-ribbon protein